MARIFILDDQPDILVLLRALLEGQGHEVHCFSAARQALDELDLRDPDLVITDLYMPEKDGIELLIELRNTGHRAVILAMSGADLSSEAPRGVISAARALGADFIAKPFRTDRFLNKVRQLLEGD